VSRKDKHPQRVQSGCLAHCLDVAARRTVPIVALDPSLPTESSGADREVAPASNWRGGTKRKKGSSEEFEAVSVG
jgi:hypothetical protein